MNPVRSKRRAPFLVASTLIVASLIAAVAIAAFAASPADRAGAAGAPGPACRIVLSAGTSTPGVASDTSCRIDPARPPSDVVIVEGAEDLDGDHAFDVFEDLNRNGRLDPGEDLDGDGRLTPPGGCEGFLREDVDCDGHPDLINEDKNADGVWDQSSEDLDGDRHFDAINEDVNHNGVLDPGEDTNINGHLDDGTAIDPATGERIRIYDAYIEDRNCNQEIDDRPFPGPKDTFDLGPFPCIVEAPPPDYPYGHFHPSRGAQTVFKLTREGAGYALAPVSGR